MMFPIYSEVDLRTPCQPVTCAEEARHLYKELEEMFPKTGALGVACPQIGLYSKASLIKFPGSDKFMLICNPEILSQEDEFIMLNEGCLSLIGKRYDTIRYRTVKVKYWDENFEERTVVANDIEAVIFCHEIDHLNGILCKDRVIQPYRAEPKQGRNERCNCGSGLKYKRCHGGN